MTSKPNRKADAIPGGGGGPNSAHRLFSQKMAARQRELIAPTPGEASPYMQMQNNDAQPINRQRGLAIGDHDWVTNKQADGELSGGSTSGTSIFDPVLAELIYRWFCPPGGLVLDPFAGGSVRGIVATMLGRRYLGVDLRSEQVAANEAQARAICAGAEQPPRWVVGDSLELATLIQDEKSDLVFSCPPYADLEVYSDDPKDISTMEYADFLVAYNQIIKNACEQLLDDRFACFVVGDARDAKGLYYGLPGDTVSAFRAAGLRLYNQAILVTSAGSLPIRVRRQFEAARKLGTTHQHVLVFIKGDPRKATEAIGPCESGEIAGESLPEMARTPPVDLSASSSAPNLGGEI